VLLAALWTLLALVVSLPAAGVLYQFLARRRDLRNCPPPGRLVEVGGVRVHAVEEGSSGPSVVLEAGIAASSLSWRLVQPRLAGFARTLSYDRAGFGWSEAAREPRRIPRLVEELRALLAASTLPPPYILVGHSYGGLLLRHFTAAHRPLVAGLVLVDPLEPAEFAALPSAAAARLARGVSLSRRGALLARLGVVRAALDLLMAGSRRLPQLVAHASSGAGATVTTRLVGEVRKLPPECWPAVRAHWSMPRSFLTMADYLARLPENCALAADDRALEDVPLIVLSAAEGGELRRSGHVRLAAASRRGVLEAIPHGGHWLHLDHPELVVEAVRRVAAAASGTLVQDGL
jgi:pimeloyl-ACP methyl ester carboxylesterase